MKKHVRFLAIFFLFLASLFTFAADKNQNSHTDIKRDPFGYPVRTVSYPEIRHLLLTRQYQKLNVLLERYQEEFEQDFRNEFDIFDTYNTFSAPVDDYQKYYDEWVQKYPDAYQPYLARAFYLTAMGWESRGYGWAKDTTEQQLKMMKKYLIRASNDIDVVSQLKPKTICLYYLLIKINSTLSNHVAKDTAIRTGLEFFPYSFLLREIYMHYSRPIWSGSYQQMDNFAEQAQTYVKINPRLRLLKGASFNEKGWRVLTGSDNFVISYIFFRIALWHGEHYDSYIGESSCYSKMHLPKMALRSINRSITLNPQSPRSYARRATVYYELGKYEKAQQDISQAYNIMPNYVTVRNAQLRITRSLVKDGFDQYKEKNYEQAIALYTWAIKIKPDYAESYYWRGQAYAYQRNLESALKDYEQSIKLDPNHFESYHSLDWVLCHSKQWDRIIDNWNRYIELNPEDGRAYRERGGAYYHKGDIKAAMADAKKAGELGDEEGQKQYERLKDMLNK